jgi:hypothetical protein
MENSSNVHFLVNRFKYSICDSEANIFSRYSFPETMLFCDKYVINMQVGLMYWAYFTQIP